MFTVYVCSVEPSVRAAFRPLLNEEHREARWFRTSDVVAAASRAWGAPAPLHPVVAALVLQHPRALAPAAAAAER